MTPGGSSAIRQRKIERARDFFAEAISPIERTHRAGQAASAHIHRLDQTLRKRAEESAASIRRLERDIAQRRAAEEALNSEKQHAKLLLEAHRLQKHVRHLAHQILSAKENERRKVSSQLHNEIAQTLLGINLRLLTLNNAAKASTETLKKDIVNTQRMVQESAKRVKLSAHELIIQR